MRKIITRFAPSSTGLMHLGSAKAAILPYVFTKQNDGKYILRIDNTDSKRSRIEFEELIFQDCQWLNIKYDETFRQIDRSHIYEKHFQALKNSGKIYECFESEEDLENFREKCKRKHVKPIFDKSKKFAIKGDSYWRFELSNETVEINDIIYGSTIFHKEYSDPVIKKPDGSFTYNFASVVDDFEKEVSHIIRGSEHLCNVFVQKQIGDAIAKLSGQDEWTIDFAHYPLFTDDSGHKISKRTGLNLSLEDLRNGYMEPMTLWSFVLFLGTSKKQIFSVNEQDYFKEFDINSISPAMQKFNFEVLKKTNSKIIKMLTIEEVKKRNGNLKFWDLLKENINSWYEFQNFCEHIESNKEVILDTFKNIEKFNIKNDRHNIQKIYRIVLGQNSGPPIEKLINFFKNYR